MCVFHSAPNPRSSLHSVLTAILLCVGLVCGGISACAANPAGPTSTAQPTPLPTAPIALPFTPTPRPLLTFADPFNDARLLPEGVACLPDYLDINRAVIAKMANGGLSIRLNLSAPLPANIEAGNHGFDFSLFLGDDIVRPVAQFRVLAAGPRYTALYTNLNIPLQPDPGFTAAGSGSQLEMTIQPGLLAGLPDTVTASLKTFFCPPGSQYCCDDFASSSRSFSLTLK